MPVFLQGENVYLSAVSLSNLSLLEHMTWIHDQEVTEFMESGTFTEDEDGLMDYINRVSADGLFLRICCNSGSSSVYIGNITLTQTSWINRTACIGIMIGNTNFWGKGYGTEAVNLLCEHAFSRMGLRKLWLGVNAEHKGAIRCYEKAGFITEARLKAELFRNGHYDDKLIMSRFANYPTERTDLDNKVTIREEHIDTSTVAGGSTKNFTLTDVLKGR